MPTSLIFVAKSASNPKDVLFSTKSPIGTMRPQRSGRKPISLLFFVPFCTRMTLRIGLNVTERWTP